jgi:hypothetical protein
MPAAGALVEMTAECGGTTLRNGPQHFDMPPTEPLAVSFDESISRSADDISHLKGWPIHLLFLRWFVFAPQRVQWTPGRVEVTFGEMQVLAGLFQIVMA